MTIYPEIPFCASISISKILPDDTLDEVFSKVVFMQKSNSGREGEYEFEIKATNIEQVGDIIIGSIMTENFKNVKNCISGLVSTDIKGKHGHQHFFWACTCLENHTQGLTLNNENIVIDVLISNRGKFMSKLT